MTTFLERIEQLGAQFERFQRVKEERDAIEALRTRGKQVADARAAADQALQSFALVERLGAKVSRKPRASAQLRATATNLAEKVAGNPEESARDPNWQRTLLEPLQNFTTRLTEATRDAWQNLVDEKAPFPGDAVFQQLERFQSAAQVQATRGARERLKQLRASLPASAGALTEIEAHNKEVQKSLQRLQNQPLAVQDFFAKAVNYTATAEDFTVEVQQYLRDNQLLHLVRIGLEK